MRRLSVSTAAVSLAIVLMVPSGGATQNTVRPLNVSIRAARLFDPASGRHVTPAVIRVTGNRISGLLEGAEATGATKVDIELGDATLLPGLIDAHVHVQIGGDPRANAAAVLRAGFTTVVDLGATSDVVFRLRDAIEARKAEGPEILAVGLWIGTRNGVCEFGGIGITGGDENFRARVRENIAAGADLLKVCVSGWPADAFARPAEYEIADSALAATVDEAHRARRLTVAHAISAGAVEAALRAGVDGLAHAAYLDADAAAKMRSRGVFLVPTLASLLQSTTGPPAEALRKSVAIAHAAGVPLVFGTDGGVLPHGQNAREFAAMVEAGVPPTEAIRAATTVAARALGRSGTLGTIAVGRAADIVAVPGDPLRDVATLSSVSFVMRGGRVIRRP